MSRRNQRGRFRIFLALCALVAGLALATQAAASDPAVLTGGQSLVPGGLALDGETLLTIGYDDAGKIEES